MSRYNSSRRDFVKTVSGGVAAGIAVGGFFSEKSAKGATESNAKKKGLGVAIVGLGSLSTNQIAPALLKTEHCHLAAIVTGTPEKEKVWAGKYGIESQHIYNYASFDKIAADESIDIVYVVLPNSMHEEYTIRAAKAGKHVFCEKPMANSAQECERMIAACKSANKQLGIGYRCQFEPHHLKIQELVQSKKFGDLRMIEAGFAFKIGDPKQWRLNGKLAGGGAMMDIGIYCIQACRFLTGEEPIQITAQETKTDSVKFKEVDESITWTMRFPSGVLSYCSTSYNFNGLNHVHAYADQGKLELNPAFGYSGIAASAPSGAIAMPETDQFAVELDDFAKCVQESRQSKVSGEEGLRDLRVIEAIYKSIREGKTISI